MDVSLLVENLENVSLFSRLGRRSLKKLAGLCVPRTFAEGEYLVRESDVGLGLYIVTRGLVRVTKAQPEGEIELARIGQGAVIGEMALIDDQLRFASVVALEPTETLLLSRESFAGLARKDPDIAWCIVPALTQRVRELDEKQMELESAQKEPEPDRAIETTRKISAETTRDKRIQRPRNEGVAEPALQMFRLQCALGIGAVEGMSGMLKISERFFSALAEETDLNRSRRIRDVFAKFPSGLLVATRKAIEEGEKLPGSAAESIRRFLERT